MKLPLTALASSITLVVAGCSADPSVPTGDMQIYETCLQTVCQELTAHSSSNCSACESACMGASYDCDTSSACSSSCSGASCSDYDKNTCNEQGFKVTLPNDPSPEVAASCRGELVHIAKCGYSVSTTAADCDRYAAVELPERASNYDCIAQLDCSSLTDSSAIASCDVAPSTFGDDLCASLANVCPDSACTSDQQALLDAEGAWVRPDAIAAAQTCLTQPSCGETAKCLSAWLGAVE